MYVVSQGVGKASGSIFVVISAESGHDGVMLALAPGGVAKDWDHLKVRSVGEFEEFGEAYVAAARSIRADKEERIAEIERTYAAAIAAGLRSKS